MRVIVFGAGRVGAAIARDLAMDDQFEVTVADIDAEALRPLSGVEGLTPVRADLRTVEMVQRLAGAHDLVVGAVPGPMGYGTVHSVIEAGRDIVDISFFGEDPYPELDDLAKKRGVMVLTDCGIAPGCSNLILGAAEAELDNVEEFSCCVGGLPTVRHQPFEYRAVFSPIDVIAEYTRPARLVENGSVVVKDALTEVELLDFEGVGTLEAFNTDGLRTLLRCDVPSMKEKTLRYPGHADKMRMLRDTGFFSAEPIEVKGAVVSPLDLTTRLLFPAWQLEEGEEDLTVMTVDVVGMKDGKRIRRSYQLLDRFDRSSWTTSMARTTGYTCTSIVRAIAAGLFREVGVSAPEVVGRVEGCFRFVLDRLAERGVIFQETET
ncbi:MAG: saccharopine dehydrogenase NADP-binding domain-containing protein [Thermoanaerobaculales bacterium]|nr:saccharopine dehydrogenase NADP-binding domain-containing protein [Thermoanaerobaculales bacterium]